MYLPLSINIAPARKPERIGMARAAAGIAADPTEEKSTDSFIIYLVYFILFLFPRSKDNSSMHLPYQRGRKNHRPIALL